MKETSRPAAALALLALFAPALSGRTPQNPVREVGDGFRRMGETLSGRLRKVAPSSDPGEKPASEQPASESQWYTLGNGEFTLDMPGEPAHDRTSPGPVSDLYRVTAQGVEYRLLIRTVRAARGSQARREASLKGHALAYTGALVEESAKRGVKVEATFDRDVGLGGFPGQQYRVSSNEGGGVIRFYVTSRHIYTLQALGATERDARVAEFLTSFRIRRR
jgi:hypothetical protein